MATHRDKDERDRTGDVLGIGRDVTPDPAIAPDRDDSGRRRRRADDIAERDRTERDPVGGPDAPPGLHVED